MGLRTFWLSFDRNLRDFTDFMAMFWSKNGHFDPFLRQKWPKSLKFYKNHDFFVISSKNGHKMGTRSSFSMKNSGKWSLEPKENTFKQLFHPKTGWGPPNFGFLRPRDDILVQILVILVQKVPIFWAMLPSKTRKFRKIFAKKPQKPYTRWKEGTKIRRLSH